MSDLISRQDAVSEIKKVFGDCVPESFEELDIAVTTLLELPSAEPERKWIPVTEALPKDGQSVLCTIKGYPEGENWTITGCRYKDGAWETCDEPAYDYWTELSDVIAWMPLPEPWRGK